MDPIPAETHSADLDATVKALERGLAVMPLSKAVNRIDDWHRMVLASERTDLGPIADGLKMLRDALTGEERDADLISRTLSDLGEHTEASAADAPESVQNLLQRLGSVLRHAGSALRPATPAAAPDA